MDERDSDSMMSFTAPQNYHQIKQLEGRIADLEKEKEFLQSRMVSLEKSNKELLSYQKSLEEAITQIGQE